MCTASAHNDNISMEMQDDLHVCLSTEFCSPVEFAHGDADSSCERWSCLRTACGAISNKESKKYASDKRSKHWACNHSQRTTFVHSWLLVSVHVQQKSSMKQYCLCHAPHCDLKMLAAAMTPLHEQSLRSLHGEPCAMIRLECCGAIMKEVALMP